MTAQNCKEIKADSAMSLFEHLRNIRTPKRPIDRPLRMTIQDVNVIGGIGTVVLGKVETGTIKNLNRNIVMGPYKIHNTKIKSIMSPEQKLVQEAHAGQVIGVGLSNTTAYLFKVKIGDVISDPSSGEPARAA